jgi:hypothetical protein
MHAALKSVLSNTHGTVDFVSDPAQIVTNLPDPSHNPAVSVTVTASQGRDRDGRSRRHPLRPFPEVRAQRARKAVRKPKWGFGAWAGAREGAPQWEPKSWVQTWASLVPSRLPTERPMPIWL